MKKEKTALDIARSFYITIVERPEMKGEKTGFLTDVYTLISISRRLHHIGVRQCNGYADTDWGRAQEDRDLRKMKKACKDAERIAQAYNATVYHQSDPRGAALYVLPNEKAEPPENIASIYSSFGVAFY